MSDDIAPMIRILVSPDSTERLAAARDFIGSFPPAAERLLVGATRDAVDHFARSVAVPLKATFGLHRFTLTQLAAHLATAEFALRGVAHSTALGAEAVAASSVFDALDQNALNYFAPVARLPGFTRALASTLAELRLAGVDTRSLSGLADSGKDLASLLGIFEEQLLKTSVADRAELFRAATGALSGGRETRLIGWPVLVLDVPIVSAAESDFLATLAARVPQVFITIPEGDEQTLRAFGSIPGAERVAALGRQPDSGLARLRSGLFSSENSESKHLVPENPANENPVEAQSEVSFFSAPGEGRECIEIARRILDEARDGVRFDQMAILLRAPAAYAGLLETALGRAGIPAFFARGSRRPDPSGRAFLAILACAAERLSANRFAEYLSLAQVPLLNEAGAPPEGPRMWVRPNDETLGPAAFPETPEERGGVLGAEASGDVTSDTDDAPALAGTLRAPWHWEKLLVEAAVVGDRDRWVRRLNGLEAELRLNYSTLKAKDPESPRALRIERDLKNLAHLAAFALPVISRLDALPASARWGVWLEHLKDLAPLVLRQPERVLRLLAELEPMSRVDPVAIDEVCGVLAERLATLEPERPPRDYGRVFAGAPEQARGRSFEVVFVPGLAERIFPGRASEDPLLLDELRGELARGLRLQKDRVANERLQLRLAAGAARRRIYFSYPRLEVAKARQRVPSFYALEVHRAQRGALPSFEEFEAEARREAQATLQWPAPPDPRRAIDDMERDLAILGELQRQPGDTQTEGRARYLLGLNAHLARSLRARQSRSGKAWSAADGLCRSTEAVKSALAPHRLTMRPYSVSALQKFALCPYQFLLSAIHRLEPRPEAIPLVRIDPLTRGAIFHRVQARFMREFQQSAALPVTQANLHASQKLLDEILEQVEQKYRDDLAPPIPQVWRDGIEGIRTDLRGWLQRAAEEPDDWLPIHFELGIGFPPDENRDPASFADPVTLAGGYQLHGVIDVVERGTRARELRVTDYKTGLNRTQEGMVLGGGEVLQPVLYGLGIELAMKERVTEGRLYFCTSVGGFRDRVVKLHDLTRQRGSQALGIIDRAVQRGFLPPAPKDRACSWCDFLDICGPNENIRTARKDQEPLDDLNTLRGLP